MKLCARPIVLTWTFLLLVLIHGHKRSRIFQPGMGVTLWTLGRPALLIVYYYILAAGYRTQKGRLNRLSKACEDAITKLLLIMDVDKKNKITKEKAEKAEAELKVIITCTVQLAIADTCVKRTLVQWGSS